MEDASSENDHSYPKTQLIPKKKREDLQGIRGIAILSVLGFHFLPSVFPNGYLGVDQFFVLSGFLMYMLLSKSSKYLQSDNSLFSYFSVVFQFYFKRLKRILPLYFLFIFLSLLSLFYIFPDTTYETNIISGERALIFKSNRATTQEEDYFSMLEIAVDIFTHTWSLSVEVQYYFIFPVIFLIGFQLISSEFLICFYGFIGLLSFVYSTLFCTESEAFNSMFSRIWQFVIGIIVYIKLERKEDVFEKTPLIENTEIDEKRTDIFQSILIYFLMFLSVFPIKITAILLRPFFTISTGFIMSISNSDSILISPFLTYIGDISYSLYLIHWPIYAYWKLVLSYGQSWNWYMLLIFILAIALSIISYEFYEKWYLNLSNTSITVLCFFLFLISMGCLHKDQFDKWISPIPPTNLTRLDGIEDGKVDFDIAEKLNHDWSVNDFKNLWVPSCDYELDLGPLGWCNHKGLDRIWGKYKLMLIGNSWAANHGRLFYEECGYRAKSIIQGSSQGCDPLFNSPEAAHCRNTVTVYGNRVTKEKPDYLFITTKFNNVGDPIPSEITDLSDDPIYKSMLSQIELMSISVRHKIFILMSLPHVKGYKVKDIVGMVKEGSNLDECDKILVERSPEMARLRYKKLMEDCEKCVAIDYKPLFWNETTNFWRFYDEKNSGLSYFTSPNHFSPHGLELVRNVYTKICKALK